MGIFDSLKTSAGSLAGGLLSLPGNVVQGYSAGYAALPQAYRDAAKSRQDSAEQRRLELERARSIAADIQAVYGDDAAGRLAQNTSPTFTANVQTERRTPKVMSPGQTMTIDSKPVYAAPDYGVSDGFAYSADPLDGTLKFGEQRGQTHGEDIQRDSLAETNRSNIVQERIADRTLQQRMKEAEDQRLYQQGTLGVQRAGLGLRSGAGGQGGGASGVTVPWAMGWGGQ